jgi:hypothetical protein
MERVRATQPAARRHPHAPHSTEKPPLPKMDKGSHSGAGGQFNALNGNYSAADGDTIKQIAHRFHMTGDELKVANPGLTDKDSVKGTILYISELILPKDPTGAKNVTTWTLEQYKARWEKDKGRAMTPVEFEVLKKGCIGITALNTWSNPIATEQLQGLSYDNFKQALAKARELNDGLRKSGNPDNLKAVIFSHRFWNNNKPDPHGFTGKDGKVDMSKYESHNNTRPGGYVNFGLWLL